jgi:hypothetical protein
MRAKVLQVGQDKRVLVAEHGAVCGQSYASVAYYSVIANTTSSSSFLQRPSRKGSSVERMPYTGISVATIATLCTVFTRLAKSSVSSSSLNSSNGFMFYINYRTFESPSHPTHTPLITQHTAIIVAS